MTKESNQPSGAEHMSTTQRGGRKRTPDKERLQKYLRRGLTTTQILEEWQAESGELVTRQAISMAIQRYGLEPANPKPRYDNLLPWRVREDHIHHYDARMLRLEGRRRAGGTLRDEDQKRLDSWKRQLDDAGAVVAYDESFPEGFVWVERRDGDDLIHRPSV